MEKYYVPEKEEFHVGFEFEVYLGLGNWGKFISEIKYDEFSDPYVELIDASNKHRVKYLDREDIESLGFEYSHRLSDANALHYEDHFRKVENVVNYELNISSEGFIKISGWYHDNPQMPITRTIFRGVVKNKSEFKVLLKQLGI